MKRYLLATALFSLTAASAWTQSEKCASQSRWDALAAKNPAMIERREAGERLKQAWLANPANTEETQAVITIPVVVHVVYNNANQNISDAQVHSQIETLNEDFRLLNADSVPYGHAFWPYTADSEIEFCLATTDPSGNATTGITRTSSTHGPFSGSSGDDVKFTSSGGRDNWDPTRYLNIWVCNLGSALYGYATFPSDLSTDPDYDGVVINFTAFGNMGTAQSPSDLGRTTTHEVGHWLDLLHIWGDDFCGDDLVSDTRPAEDANYGCPGFPYNPNNSCGTDSDGEMYMNYMDYVDDNCMNMFTFGQKSRMRATLANERLDLQSSQGCSLSAAAPESTLDGLLSVAPNPSSGQFTLSLTGQHRKANLVVMNTLGAIVHSEAVTAFPHTIDLGHLSSDLYLLQVQSGKQVATRKVVVTH